MAKVSFAKLQASINTSEHKNCYRNKAGEEIYYDVKQYLPLEEKISVIEKIVNQSVDDNGFYNPMKVKLYMTLEVVFAYTNLNFTEKMLEDYFKLYDLLVSTGIFKDVLSVIGNTDWVEIQEGVWDTIENIYNYRNSAMGILSYIASDYSAVEMDVSKLQHMLADPDGLNLLKDVMSKLG